MTLLLKRLFIAVVCLIVLISSFGGPSRAAETLIIWNSLQPPMSGVLDQWLTEYPPLKDGSLGLDVRSVPHFALGEFLDNPPNGQLPDLILASSDAASILAERRLLAVLDSDLSGDLRARFAQIAWDLATYERNIVAVPLALEGLVLYQNRALTEDINPTIFDGLLQALESLNNADQVGLIFNLDAYSTAGLYLAEGGTYLNARGESLLEASLNQFTRYLTTIRDLAERAKRGEFSYNSGDQAFLDGKAGFIIAPSSYLPKYQLVLGDTLQVVGLPALKNGPWRPMVRAYQFYVMPRTTKRAIAIDFANFATQFGGGGQMGYGLVSARSDTIAMDALEPSVMAGVLQSGVPQPNRPEMAVVWRAMSKAIRAVVEEGVDPAVAARAAATEAKEGILALRTQ
ncbi:MAG: hypothetical protein OHK0023_15230 [Anaerolineae bacterium]